MSWRFEKVAGPFLEKSENILWHAPHETNGPVWDGEALLFAAVGENRILRYHPTTGKVAEYRNYTVAVKGLALDGKGELYVSQSGARRIARLGRDGSTHMLADRFEGSLHNQPYDLVIDTLGRIWFTDYEAPQMSLEPVLGFAAVLRLDPAEGGGWVIRKMADDCHAPKGIVLSEAAQTLFVTDNQNGLAQLRAYPLEGEGLGAAHVLFERRDCVMNGLCLDSAGRIVVCIESPNGDGAGTLAVVSSQGELVGEYPLPDGQPTNCALGGCQGRDIYVTSTDAQLYRASSIVI